MTSQDTEEYGPDTTYCEWLAKTRWGAYINEIEKNAIMIGHGLCPETALALEIGCEGGRWSRMLTGMGWDMICTDVNPSFMDVCRQRLPKARCVVVSPNDDTLPCDSQSISLLLCVGVPPAIQSPWFISEAARVLKPGGVVVGTYWNLLSLRGFGLHLKGVLTGGDDYYKSTYVGWRRKLRDRGFRIRHEEGYCWFPFRRASNSALVPYAVRVERGLGLGRLAAVSPWVAFVATKDGRGGEGSR
jgi:SAM-dependent methyltransferase